MGILDKRKSLVEFRLANGAVDLPHIVFLAEEAHGESRFGYIPFCAEKTRKVARRALDDPKRHGVMLAFKKDEPIGILYCSIGEYHIGTDVLLTTIHNVNVLKSVRETLAGGRAAVGQFNGARSWSKARGAQEILLHVTSGVGLAGTHRFAKKMGFEFVGGSYVRKT